MADTDHKCWTVNTTNYLRNLDGDDLKGECVAIHYQDAPVEIEGGTRISLRFPALIVSLYSAEQQKVAERVAAILNRHWNDEDIS